VRGTAAGEAVVSQANTPQFEAGYDRVFGAKTVQRGRWVWDAEQGKLVPANEYKPPEHAIDAPIMVDRFYEGQVMQDGTPVGSRRRYANYLREHDVAHTSDFSDLFREKVHRSDELRTEKEIRETVGRSWYELENPRRR
jgi:hypothetical protein